MVLFIKIVHMRKVSNSFENLCISEHLNFRHRGYREYKSLNSYIKVCISYTFLFRSKNGCIIMA